MNRTRWLLMPLVVLGLSGWAYGQATADQAPIDADTNLNAERDVSIDVESGMEQEVEGDTSELRRWAEQEPIRPRQQREALRETATRPAQQDAERPMQQPRADREIRQQTDVYIFNDQEGAERPGYWAPRAGEQAQRQRNGDIFAFRDRPAQVDRDQLEQEMSEFREFRGDRPFRGGVYGYAEDGQRMPNGLAGAPPAGGAVGHTAISPTREDASSSWRRARNLVDDNYIQNRDDFMVDRDFYTKEWKVSQPPLVPRPRFHTIYDNDFTQQYYTVWHGSPVVWAPNRMVPTPMPQTRNQMFTSDSQMVTFWTGWHNEENLANTPQPFAATTGIARFDPYRGGVMASDLYGYQEGTSSDPHTGMTSIDGSIRHGRSALFWDDQDLLSTGGITGLAGTTGFDTYGYVSPEAGRALVTPVPPDGDVLMNVPRPRDLNIYGVPGPAAMESERPDAFYSDRGERYGYYGGGESGYQTYGYVETERSEVKVKKADKDCPDHDRDVRWDEID